MHFEGRMNEEKKLSFKIWMKFLSQGRYRKIYFFKKIEKNKRILKAKIIFSEGRRHFSEIKK